MNASLKTMTIFTVALLGIYGCAKAPQAAEERGMREKIQKLEADHKALTAARDQYRDKLQALELQHAALSQELADLRAASARELSAFAEQLRQRTTERDTVLQQYEGFRKTLKDLIGQAEASLPASIQPLASAGSTARSN